MSRTPQPSFLGEVAQSLYARYGAGLSELSLLFPSRRARLFFSEELAHLAERPLWEPEWLTLDELMEELSGLHTGDRLRLIAELYRVYSHYHTEDFDHFYFWGEMLLSDFDMLDKYRVDADLLFRNIADLKELEADLSYLTDEQRRIINRFWEGVLHESADTEERRRFLRIWNTLGPIYREYGARLRELGFAYPGMVQRTAADRLKSGEAEFARERRYVVAGFNALSECEKMLFARLKALGAEFFWDYDQSYVRPGEQEAGMFLRDNISRFPETGDGTTHDNFIKDKTFQVVSTASNAAQCKYVPELLDTFRETGPDGGRLPLDKRTAIVLTDENLLVPLLCSLESGEDRGEEENEKIEKEEADETPESRPEAQERPAGKADRVNVTMGFPLKQTTAYTFVERLLELQAHGRKQRDGYAFYHADVCGLLDHPYIGDTGMDPTDGRGKWSAAELRREIVENRRITIATDVLGRSELLRIIFAPTAGWRELSDWLLRVLEAVGGLAGASDGREERIAFLNVTAEEISKLRNSLDECNIELSTSTYASLLRRHLQSLRIPYEGEPLDGIQVMGILETRNLDFENVILLSMTDDNFPGKTDAQSSFVPYNLRAAYGLPTPEHHEGVYSYYFYRLIQRARRVVMCYCSHADDKSTGEPSRYIRQLEYEGSRPIAFTEVGVDVNLPEERDIEVEKSGEVWERLQAYLQEENPHALSPTAFARYIACPLKFYFASIAHMKEKEEITDEVDNPAFGNVLHASMQRLYERIRGEAHPGKTLKAIAADGSVERVVGESIAREIFRDETVRESDYPGNVLLVRDIIVRYIREGILPYDARRDDFAVEGLEAEVSAGFAFDGPRRVLFAGKADRIDRMDDGSLRVVDYKTGGVHLEFNGLDDLFLTKNRGMNANIFQTMLYSLMLWHDRGLDARPALYYVRRINRDDFSPALIDRAEKGREVRYSLYREPFEEALKEKLRELFDPSVPFRPCAEREICQYCDFKTVCRR